MTTATTGRFDMNASDVQGAARYFEERAVQLLVDGYTWTGNTLPLLDDQRSPWGLLTTWLDAFGQMLQSVYVLAPRRGQGHLTRFAAGTIVPFLTLPDCEMEPFFRERKVPHVVAGRFTSTLEYRVIAAHYGGRRAARSEVPYMRHIDEGLAVLRHLKASERAQRAWCLHPLVQSDEALADNYPALHNATESPQVLALALEYRNIANACLSHRGVRTAADIALGPLSEVADMLRADKVQNYKDFLLHHRESHPRRAELDRYFRLWLERLGVSQETFAHFFQRLQVGPDRAPLPSGDGL